MHFREILGQQHIKNHLITTAKDGRIPHAQLFVGREGSGTLPMALAYAQYLLCGNSEDDNEGGDSVCNLKCATYTHPDLHFAFPVATSDKAKSRPISSMYLEEWRDFLKEQPYGNLFDWYRLIGVERKQGQIGVDEAHDIVKRLSLKSYEGGHKILVLWMAEKMNASAANKLLKLIEEPPQQTVLLLIAEEEEHIIATIRSRCQILHFPPLPEAVIATQLEKKEVSPTKALQLAHEANGNYNKALDLLHQDSEDLVFEQWFVHWVRSAFKAKGNKAVVNELLQWSEEVAKTGREVQKKFLHYCLGIVRQALLLNYQIPELVYSKIHVEGFDLSKFAPFVHENNISELVHELETAALHIERNGNSRIVFADLSIKLTRLLHVKAS
ncbi:MAG: DNA polymerase III subunit delta' [Bacteroidota bacterium]